MLYFRAPACSPSCCLCAATRVGASEIELNEAGRLGMLIAGFGTFFASTGLTHEEYRMENDKVFAYMRQQGQQKAA